MLSALLGIQPRDRRAAWMGAGTLLVVIAAHTLMETARDALFLRDLPATQLPWAYLGIAAIACAVGMAGGRMGGQAASRWALQLALVTGAGAAAAFWMLTARPGPAVLLSLYVWTGVFASVVVMLLWLFLSEHVDVAQAKRIYALVAAGGLAGAAAGGVAAALILTVAPPRALLLASGGLLLVATQVPRAANGLVAPTHAGASSAGVSAARLVGADPYVRRVVAVALLAAMIFTGIDYVYKSSVSRDIAGEELGPFFARYNAAVYGAALLVHVLLASRLLRGLGVIRALAVLPVVLLLGSGAVAATGGLVAVLALKGADVTLRHSLHRASTEILFLPIAGSARSAVKGLADGLGQRGGQAIASLLLLWAGRRGVTLPALGAILAAASGLWVALVAGLRRHYVDRFRTQLSELLGEREVTVPDLDLHSLEALVAALGSPHDAEVLAALDILEDYGKSTLVSPFIMYHPSRTVALRAIDLFAGSSRDDVRAIQRRLLAHDDPGIRAATVRSLGCGAERETLWRIVQEDGSPEVRATALVVLLCDRGEVSHEEAESIARDVLAVWAGPARGALARTLRNLPRSITLPLARHMLAEADAGVRRELALALGDAPDVRLLDVYTSLLAHRESREPARQALTALGAPALRHLARALEDPATPAAVRLHAPRTISRFRNEEAAAVLVSALVAEDTPRVRYKILRGLGRMRADDPELPVDRGPLLAEARDALARGVTALLHLVAYELLLAVEPQRRRHPDLLATLLREKERRALERLFRILHILEPTEQYRGMFEGLSARDPAVRATSRELLEHVIGDPGLRTGILAMSEPEPARRRLPALLVYAEPALGRRVVELTETVATGTVGAAERAEMRVVLGPLFEAMRRDRDPVLSALADRAVGSGASPSRRRVSA